MKQLLVTVVHAWANAFALMALSILIFVPIKYIYPSRSPRFRVQSIVLGALWGVAILYAIYRLPEPPRAILFASLLYPAYYTALSLWLEYLRLTESPSRG